MIPEKYVFLAARKFPTIAFFSTLLLSLYYREKLFYVLFILFNIAEVSNRVMKYFAKKMMGNKKFEIIGKGTRPNQKLSKSYGMPSGHSQGAAILATYLALHVNNSKMDRKILINAALILGTLFIMYSRVVEKWHTIQQVIIGASIGIFLGYTAYMIIN